MNRGPWQATVHGIARVRHDLATKPPSPHWKKNFFQLKKNYQPLFGPDRYICGLYEAFGLEVFLTPFKPGVGIPGLTVLDKLRKWALQSKKTLWAADSPWEHPKLPIHCPVPSFPDEPEDTSLATKALCKFHPLEAPFVMWYWLPLWSAASQCRDYNSWRPNLVLLWESWAKPYH